MRRNALYGLAGFAAPACAVLICYPVLIRHLGPPRFGAYVLAGSLSALLSFLDFGFAAATVKRVAERPAAAAEIILTALAFCGLSGVAWAALIAFFAPGIATGLGLGAGSEILWALRLAGLQFPLFLLLGVCASVFKGLERFGYSTVTLAAVAVLCQGGAALAAAAGGGLAAVMAANVAAHAIVLPAAAGAGYRLCRACGMAWNGARPSRAAFRRLAGFGGAVCAHSVAAAGLYQLQRYAVSAALGPPAVLAWQVANAGPAKVHQAVAAAAEALFPLASAGGRAGGLRASYRKMQAASAIAAGAALLALVVLAPPALALWLGPAVAAPALPLVPVYALAYFLITLSPAPFHLLNGLGRPGVNTAFCALTALVNAVLIALLWRTGISLGKFAWAFAAANAATGLLFQVTVEFRVWRRAPAVWSGHEHRNRHDIVQSGAVSG